MWLGLAGLIIVLGFVFGEHVNLLWLIAIVGSVFYCWTKHDESKTGVSALDSNAWGDYVTRTVGVVADNYWEHRRVSAATGDDAFLLLKDGYVKHLQLQVRKLPANSVVINSLKHAINGVEHANSITALCEAWLTVRGKGDYILQSDIEKLITVMIIRNALSAKNIPNSLIFDEDMLMGKTAL